MIHIELPPLRGRGEDVVLLAETFLRHLKPKGSAIDGFADETLDRFRQYRWPGNIRELRNVIERSVALTRGTKITLADLPPTIRHPEREPVDSSAERTEISRDEALDHADRAYLRALLKKHDDVIASAARQAGLSRQGMNKLLRRHRIDADEFR